MPLKSALLILIFSVLLITSCNDSSRYRKLVEKELATNVRNDTLLHGIRFGMNKREFFAHCWDQHKKGVFQEGYTNTTVFYEFERDGKKYHVNFYPKFSSGKIVELPVEYTYPAFAPWNKEYTVDLLHQEVVQLYKEEYGEDYLTIPSKKSEGDTAYVWVNGNRRISVYRNLFRNSVTALYFDLSYQESETASTD